MNSKITKRHLIGLSFVICHLSFSMMLASCSDWDGHYEDPASLADSEPTLWQMMQQRSDISDFCEVLSKTKIYKHHKKTDVLICLTVIRHLPCWLQLMVLSIRTLCSTCWQLIVEIRWWSALSWAITSPIVWPQVWQRQLISTCSTPSV